MPAVGSSAAETERIPERRRAEVGYVRRALRSYGNGTSEGAEAEEKVGNLSGQR